MFRDTTVPMGTSRITYDIHAVRGKMRGEPSMFNVFFGMSATAPGASARPAPKIAA